MNNRRKLVMALGASALAAPFSSFAQKQGKVWRIGNYGITAGRHLYELFRAGMADLGYREGHNVHYEELWSDGGFYQFERDARELVSTKVDLILVIRAVVEH